MQTVDKFSVVPEMLPFVDLTARASSPRTFGPCTLGFGFSSSWDPQSQGRTGRVSVIAPEGLGSGTDRREVSEQSRSSRPQHEDTGIL